MNLEELRKALADQATDLVQFPRDRVIADAARLILDGEKVWIEPDAVWGQYRINRPVLMDDLKGWFLLIPITDTEGETRGPDHPSYDEMGQ